MKKLLSGFALIMAVLIASSSLAFAQKPNVYGNTGIDMGWPNCYNSVPRAAFGIVGVNYGEGYSQNPCLTKEASHFGNSLSLYANTGWYPLSTYNDALSPKQCNTGDENCLAYNYGYNAGLYALNYARSQGISSSQWWLDVETGNTWSSSPVQNQNSLQGEYDALSANGATTIGVYSTTIQWDSITGNWLNNWPSWGATTWTSPRQAETYCTGHEFTGGPSYLMQYKSRSSRLDQDVSC
ncbi:MAG: hypothetical protein ACREF5_02915 [Candidatus Saccharimonadales bacterium]